MSRYKLLNALATLIIEKTSGLKIRLAKSIFPRFSAFYHKYSKRCESPNRRSSIHTQLLSKTFVSHEVDNFKVDSSACVSVSEKLCLVTVLSAFNFVVKSQNCERWRKFFVNSDCWIYWKRFERKKLFYQPQPSKTCPDLFGVSFQTQSSCHSKRHLITLANQFLTFYTMSRLMTTAGIASSINFCNKKLIHDFVYFPTSKYCLCRSR